MATVTRSEHTGGNGLFIIGTVFYMSFIGLFLWQTAAFVSWLFPQDQILYRIITVSVFDIMALFWAVVDTFYRFATRVSHNLVKWAWAISFVAAMLASIFYMALQSMTRLNFQPDGTWVNTGYCIVIAVTVLQILFLTFFIRIEWMKRHPRVNDYEYDVQGEYRVATPEPPAPKVLTPPAQPQQKVLTPPVSAQPRRLKKLPRARTFTPRQSQAAHVDTEEVKIPTGPLAQSPAVKVKRNRGAYIVNQQAAKIPLND